MLNFYVGRPFNSVTQCLLNDLFIGDGTTTTFALLNKLGYQTGGVIQSRNTQYNLYNGGFAVNGNNIVFPTAPPNLYNIIDPGVTDILISAYDASSVPGDSTPNIAQVPIYLADPTDIALYQYEAQGDLSGIQVNIINNDPGYGADLSWLNTAPALADGSAGTFVAAGTQYFDPIQAADLLQDATTAGGSTFVVADGSQFTAGRFIIVDVGLSSEETVRVLSISTNTLTTETQTQNHSVGANVYENGVQFWLQVTIPSGASGGSPTTWFNLGAQCVAAGWAR